MDLLVKTRGEETHVRDVVRHGNTGTMWYRVECADGELLLFPMEAITLVSYREDPQLVDPKDIAPEVTAKMLEALKPKKPEEGSLTNAGKLALSLEADIRELHGANPNELAVRLVEKGWKK